MDDLHQYLQPVLDITEIAEEFGFPGQTIISPKLYNLLMESAPDEPSLMGAIATLCGMTSRTPPAADNNHYIATRFNGQLQCIQAEAHPEGYIFNLVEGVQWEEVQAEEDEGVPDPLFDLSESLREPAGGPLYHYGDLERQRLEGVPD